MVARNWESILVVIKVQHGLTLLGTIFYKILFKFNQLHSSNNIINCSNMVIWDNNHGTACNNWKSRWIVSKYMTNVHFPVKMSIWGIGITFHHSGCRVDHITSAIILVLLLMLIGVSPWQVLVGVEGSGRDIWLMRPFQTLFIILFESEFGFIMRITSRLKSSVGIWPDKFPPKHS